MRKGMRRWTALVLAALMCVPAAFAEGFTFGGNVREAAPSVPGNLFELPTARRLRELPALQASGPNGGLTLKPDTPLPDGVSVTLTATDGQPAGEAAILDGSVAVPEVPGMCWLTLSWREEDAAVAVQYVLTAPAGCEFWAATADDGQYAVTRKGASGSYTLELAVPGVSRATLYYNGEGRLQSSILLGDEREPGTLPMILQYDEYGRPVMISAADIQHTYTFSRAQGVWEDEAGQAAASESLPVFSTERHPAPAALPLEIPPVHLSEAGAGIDRAALMTGAPALTELNTVDGAVRFTSDADSAELITADGLCFSTDYGTLSHDGNLFSAVAEGIYADPRIQLVLKRGGITAVYRVTALESVSDAARGIFLAADGTLMLSQGACEAKYNAKGNLTEARIQSADGATLIYNRLGRLVGWEMDGYTWAKEGGWRTTAYNENGNVIRPAVKQPAAVSLNDYPAITLEE